MQPYAMLCRADGLKLYDDNGVRLKVGILMQPRSILNPLKTSGGQPVALGSSVFGVHFGIRLIIFVFGDFCVFKERFCGNASHPVVAFVSVVAFCGLF